MNAVRARLTRPVIATAVAAGVLAGGLFWAVPGGTPASRTLAGGTASSAPSPSLLPDDAADTAGAPVSTERLNVTTTADDGTGSGVQAVKASCGSNASGFTNTWGPVSRSNCSVFGSRGRQVTYTFWIKPGTQQSGTVRVWGINSSNKGQWYNAGTVRSSTQTHRITVPWGNNAATPRVQVKGGPGALWSVVEWRH
ncbi:hypothetical protein ACFCX4_15250 [Kitasatospora sp. NPDC056327]|uniref:hypothetical protein n=1 Tax=Kitasatospora sp. NPDC056327 TaxID=3345785 RepID=UPI0035DC0014